MGQVSCKGRLSLQELQRELLNILVYFDSLCKELDLTYSLDGGTLLGAIRHHGFIPWDDDIDVMMPRRDIETLLEFQSENSRYLLTGMGAGGSWYPYLKLTDKSIRAQEKELEGVKEEYLWIDIFPTDILPDNRADVDRYFKKKNLYLKFATAALFNPASCSNRAERFCRVFFKKTIGVFVDTDFLFEKVNKMAANLAPSGGTYMENITWAAKDSKYKFPRQGFEEMTEVEFEGHLFPAVGCWDEYLTSIYGDYMELPPENRRVNHGVLAWRI